MEAYRLYMLGRYHFDKSTQEGWTNAFRYYNEAVRLDPNYAVAYCGMADNYAWMGGFVMPGKLAWAKSKELAQKALMLDPNLAEGHLSLGIALWSTFDWQGGEAEIKHAIELNPRLALAHYQYAVLLAQSARFDEAIAPQKKALDLDPLSGQIGAVFGWVLWLAGRHQDAIIQARKAIEVDPNSPFTHSNLGWMLIRHGEPEAAIAEYQKAQELDNVPSNASAVGCAYAVSGNRAKAEQVLLELENQSKLRYVSPATRVSLHLRLGEKNKALDWLEKCYAEQDVECLNLKVDPIYDSIRTEPRFQALLKKVGLDR